MISNINEVIRALLNTLLFFCKMISHAPKAQKHNQAKVQNANKRTKVKNGFKRHLSGKE